MPKKTKARAAKRRTNPSSLYWRVGTKTPWRTGPQAIVARDRATLMAQRHPGVVLPSVRKRVAARSKAARPASKRASARRSSSPRPARRAAPAPLKLSVVAAKPPARSVKRTRRNPPATVSTGKGIVADFKGLGAALADLGRNPKRRALATRFKDAKDPFRIVIVRDMWLTGFDAPCLHTMYADKPMSGHGLMQAIARVNRVFRDKPGGLVVDYLGLADQLKHALATYTESGGKGSPSIDTAQAIAVMEEKHEIACGIMHGFDWSLWTTGTGEQQLKLIPPGQEHVLQQENGKARFVQVVTDLSRAFALCAATDAAIAIRDDIAFFQAIKVHLTKTSGRQRPPEELDAAVRQLVSSAIMADEGIIDVFTAAGLKKPDISILSDQFLSEVRGLKHKNVAAELLAKLLRDEIATRSPRNVVQARQFSEMLQQALNQYHNRAIATQEVIEELIALAKKMSAATKRGTDLGLTDEEIAFYDALAANESAVKAMGDAKLRLIAAELVTQVRKSVTIDWTLRDGAQAKIRVMVKRILNKYGYPPDMQDAAVQEVLAQARELCADWATEEQTRA